MSGLMRPAQAGTMESNDVFVTIAPASGEGIQLNIISPVLKQYGDQIRNVVLSVLGEFGIKEAQVQINDKGALDCTIRARVETAVSRAMAKEVSR